MEKKSTHFYMDSLKYGSCREKLDKNIYIYIDILNNKRKT